MAAHSALGALLRGRGVGALLVSHLPKIRRLCGFTGSRALLLARPRTRYLLTDGRYAEQAQAEVRGARVVIGDGSFCNMVRKKRLLRGIRRVLFESDYVTVEERDAWQEAFPSLSWIGGAQLLQDFLAQKTQGEIARMRQAQAISEAVFAQVLQIIRPGMTEREVAAEVVCAHLRGGAERMSFDPIIASGPRSALPHARPSDRCLRKGDVVLMDFGCFYQGYASDMTRMVALGDPGPEVRRVHAVVLDAHRRAVDCAKAGVIARALDAAARSVIDAAGYGPNFTHGLGHGIGLEVHAWPSVSAHAADRLLSGTTITIEPGVYLPGAFGIRIEDTVVLQEKGCARLGTLDRALTIL